MDDLHRLFCIVDGEKVKGYVYVEADPTNGEGSIEYIAVASDYRRQGIAKQLLQKALQFLYSTGGLTTVRLSVGLENTATINLYKSVGFQEKYHLYSLTKKYHSELEEAIELRTIGEYEKSNKLLLQLAANDPTNATIQYHCAWSYDVLGEESKAVPYYEKAIELGLSSKKQEGALLGLGSTYRTLGRYKDSESILTRGIQEFPNNRAIPVFLSMTYYNLGKTAQAMEILLNTIASSSADEEIQTYKKAIHFYADKLDEIWE